MRVRACVVVVVRGGRVRARVRVRACVCVCVCVCVLCAVCCVRAKERRPRSAKDPEARQQCVKLTSMCSVPRARFLSSSERATRTLGRA